MSALSELLNRHFAERFPDQSNRAIAKVAGVSRGTIDNYRNGTHPATPGEDVLAAFHKLLDIPMGELREAAGQYVGEDAPYIPPAEANRMSIRQRRAVDELIRSIVETRGATDDRPADQPARDDPPTEATRTPGLADQKSAPVHAGDVDSGTDPEGKAADEARPNVWRDKPTPLSDRRSRRQAEPEPLPEELPEDAWAARTRDPRFAPDIPEDDGVGEESQETTEE